MATGKHSRPGSTASASGSASGSLMQDVPGSFPPEGSQNNDEANEQSTFQSLSKAVHARRAEYVRPKHVRIKVGTWNVASHKGTEKDVGGWFVQGKGVTEALAGLRVDDQAQFHKGEVPDKSGLDEREDVASQEARYERKKCTIPEGDPGSLPGDGDIGLYVLGLQEVLDINSVSEALRPYTDPGIAKKWKDSMQAALPEGYQLVAEQQLLGLLLLIYVAPDLVGEVRSISTTSVGTGVIGYMGNKGAVTARIVLGETTRLVFVDAHMAAGADKTALERRNWDASQITSRTRFEPIKDSMGLSQNTGEQIGDEDFAFWMGDLNYRLKDIPGDDVRRLLMLHTRNEYDLSQRSARKIERELQSATESVKRRVENRTSTSSNSSVSQASTSGSEDRTSMESQSTALTLIDELEASDDPTSLQTTLSSLLPHDELHRQMAERKAFYDGWVEGPITFLPTYKYDVGSVGVFDSSEKKRAPSWCDRILYRTRRGKLAYEAKIKEEEESRKRDEEMKANGTDQAANDDDILYDYDPDNDGTDDYDDYDEYEDVPDNVVITKGGFEDELTLEYYTAHQRVLSSDHKPLNAVFMLKYDAVVPELKARVHAEVAKELDRAENEGRPSVTVVVDKHAPSDVEISDSDPANFEGVWFGDVRWGQAKHRNLTIANTGRAQATFVLIERPVGPGQATGLAPSWLNLKINDTAVSSSSTTSEPVKLEPGDTASVELELRIFDINIVKALNEGVKMLDDILVLRVEDGRDHFIPVRGLWQDSSLGRSIDRLIRIPEGGIRRLQRQKPHGRKSKSSGSLRSSRSGSISSQTRPSGNSLDEQQPVRYSAPRELFRLTEAIEELSSRVIAEWEMMQPAATSGHESEGIAATTKAPWTEHPGWPFEESAWTGSTTPQWQDALSQACEALDTDESLIESLPADLPRLQQLYVLSDLLLILLHGMPEGIVTEDAWSDIDAFLLEADRSKRRPTSSEEERTAIQEILSRVPSHNISFILVTSMLERILQEVGNAGNAGAGANEAATPVSSPGKRAGGTLRRMTTFVKAPVSAPSSSPLSSALHTHVPPLARIFAAACIRTSSSVVGGDKMRNAAEKRRVEAVEVFLRRDEI